MKMPRILPKRGLFGRLRKAMEGVVQKRKGEYAFSQKATKKILHVRTIFSNFVRNEIDVWTILHFHEIKFPI